jgi:hypothetical protein
MQFSVNAQSQSITQTWPATQRQSRHTLPAAQSASVLHVQCWTQLPVF